jgi:hypothetical protein
MSEFKFACPVCGQHITADSSTSGSKLECPTCFRKIVVPQAPASSETKFILAASQADKPRPPSSLENSLSGAELARPRSFPAGVVLVILLCAMGTLAFVFREKLFSKAHPVAEHSEENLALSNAPRRAILKSDYPMPTNTSWTLEATNLVIPEETVVGSIRGQGFRCERATLQGGNLTLRQGKAWPPDFGLTVVLFAKEGEELSGKSVEVAPDRAPPRPKVVLRWKDDQEQPGTKNFQTGYLLRVTFGEAAEGRIPGKVFAALPDNDKSFVAGTFIAEIRKPPPAKPKPPKGPTPPKPPKPTIAQPPGP